MDFHKVPLSSERQFLKNINRKLLVELKEKGQIVEGKLIAFQKNELHLEIEEKLKGKKAQLKLVEILLENIVKAKVTVSFK